MATNNVDDDNDYRHYDWRPLHSSAREPSRLALISRARVMQARLQVGSVLRRRIGNQFIGRPVVDAEYVQHKPSD